MKKVMVEAWKKGRAEGSVARRSTRLTIPERHNIESLLESKHLVRTSRAHHDCMPFPKRSVPGSPCVTNGRAHLVTKNVALSNFVNILSTFGTSHRSREREATGEYDNSSTHFATGHETNNTVMACVLNSSPPCVFLLAQNLDFRHPKSSHEYGHCLSGKAVYLS